MEGHEKVTDVLNVVKHVHVRNESKLLVVVVAAAAAVGNGLSNVSCHVPHPILCLGFSS